MGDDAALPRPARKRQQRSREFLDAAQHIVFQEGFEGLTMSRLAKELDTVDSAVYRYFPSKGAIIAELQRESIERLSASLARITERADGELAAAGVDDRLAAVARLVLLGRWFCATSETYPEELRLFGMIMSRRATALDPEGGERIFPVAMALLARAMSFVEAGQAIGVIREGSAIDRTVMLAAALGGLLEADDLEHYAPELFGGTRLARRLHLDVLAGWGADAALLDAASELVDRLADGGPLAP